MEEGVPGAAGRRHLSRSRPAALAPPLITDPRAPRPSRPIRLVALDLDGTCIDEQQRLHPRVGEAVRRTAARLPVVIATGRMFPSATPWARTLGVTAPLICYQGGAVRELPPDTGDPGALGPVILEVGLEPGPALHALHLARAHDWHFQAYRDERTLCEQDRPEGHLYARVSQTPVTVVDDLEPIVGRGTIKAVCVVEDMAEAQRCEDMMRGELGPSARVVRSLPPFIEIVNPKAGKARALAAICERVGVEPAAVLAAGDAPNDADMLAFAGFAAAVEGAHPEVLGEADALCARPEHAGVADLLEVLGLTG